MNRSRLAIWLRWLLLAGIWLLASSASAETAEPSEQSKALFRLSGLEKQIQSIEPQTVDGIATQASQLPPELQEVLVRIARETFATDVLTREALARLDAQIVPGKAEQALVWLRSPQGRKITSLEEAASTGEGIRGLQSYAASLQENMPAATRVELVRRLDTATGATQLLVDTAIATTLAVVVALDATSDAPKTIDDLKKELEPTRAQLRPVFEQTMLVSFLYTYRDLSDEKLVEYIEFLESDTGSWYNRVASQAMVGAITASTLRLGESMKTEIDGLKAKKSL